MRYALVNNELSLPISGMTATCPHCGSALIAKCGTMRVHHWAHRGERSCDVWWEPKTAWHYNWQDKFPQSWREVTRYAASGEKHIADIHTERGITIEFQYSHLKPDERYARENFYGNNLVWVVSGARLRRDMPRFLKGRQSLVHVWRKGVFVTRHPEDVFPPNWLGSTAPVFFDFEHTADSAEALWCLLPVPVLDMAVVLRVSRNSFVRWAHERVHLLPLKTILDGVLNAFVVELKRQAAIRHADEYGLPSTRMTPRFRMGPRRV